MIVSPSKQSIDIGQCRLSDLGMESPDQPNSILKAETGTGFINVINEADWYPSPRAMEVIKSFEKECIAKLEDRVA